MYDIYIKNYLNPDGTPISSEQLLYSIPYTDPTNILKDPVVKTEMGKAGSFEFGLWAKHLYFNGLQQLKTIFRVVYDGDTIFRGRVLTTDISRMTGDMKVHCEGDLAFLLDSQQQGVEKKYLKKITLSTYLRNLINNHNAQVVESGSMDKMFELGEVPGNYTSATSAEQRIPEKEEEFGSTSWETTMAALETLQKSYGGYFRTRYVTSEYIDTIGQYGEGNIDLNNRIVIHNDDGSISTERSFSTNIDGLEVLLPTIVNGIILSEDAAIDHYFSSGEYLGKFSTVEAANDYAQRLHERQDWYYNGRKKITKAYLDWLDNWFNPTVNSQTVDIGKNLIDLTDTHSADNIFTALIPIGNKRGSEITIEGYRTDIHGTNNKRILVPQIVGLFTDAQLNKGFHTKEDYQQAIQKYGIIYKTQKFENADTQEKLWNYATEWILDNYLGGTDSITLSALDLRHVSGSQQKFLTGDRIQVSYPNWRYSLGEGNKLVGGRELIVKIVPITQSQYNLHEPERNSYTIGVPPTTLSKTYGTAQKTAATKSIADENNTKSPLVDKVLENEKELRQRAWKYIIDEKDDNKEYRALIEENPDLANFPSLLKCAEMTIYGFLKDPSGKSGELFRSIVLSGGKLAMSQDHKYSKVLNPAWEEPSKVITSMVFDIYEGNIELKRKMWADELARATKDTPLETVLALSNIERGLRGLTVYKEGHSPESQAETEVAASLGTSGNGMTGMLTSALGSFKDDDNNTSIFLDGVNEALQMYKTSTSTEIPTVDIDGTDAKVDLKSNPYSLESDVSLNKTVTYTDSSGRQKTQNGFVVGKDFGIYDETSTENVPSLKTKLVVADRLIANKAEISELEALKARINELEATYINTDKLDARLANATVIVSSSVATSSLEVSKRKATWMSNTVCQIAEYTAPALEMTEPMTFTTTTGEQVVGRLVLSYLPGALTKVQRPINYLGSNPVPNP